ncbi:MAG: hypothetical protein KTR14_02295 [Vampirovibrio sp.]|nr:hypothetical protein [Vampirovibrio sp.]
MNQHTIKELYFIAKQDVLKAVHFQWEGFGFLADQSAILAEEIPVDPMDKMSNAAVWMHGFLYSLRQMIVNAEYQLPFEGKMILQVATIK